ncbi:MAG: AsmA family protein [Desulfuromusa sp.]|nr:AsmA family protein [Desulfuromusa sp.]
MSTPVKIIIFMVGMLLILAVALTVVIKTQVTPEKVRETLLPLAEKSLHRNVDFGEIKIGLFSGISVADLQVMQKKGDEEFFSVKAVELHYQFLPLLTGKVVVDQILLDQPKISVTRLPEGQFNFSDLLPESTGDKSATVVANDKESTSLPKAFNLLVKEVDIKGGELQYVDKFINARSPFRYALEQLNFKARQITFDKAFPIDLSAVINDSNIDISGHYDLSRQAGDLIVHLAPLNLVQFAPYYRSAIPGKLGSAQLALNLEVDIEPELISSKGQIDLKDVDLVLDQFPKSGLKGAKLGADYALSFNPQKQLLKISTLLLNFNEINLGAEGEFDLSAAEPYMVLTLLLKQFDLREVMQNLPGELSKDYQKYSFAGLIDGQISLSGKLDSGIGLVNSAQFSLSDVRASSENLRAGISGDITYVDKVLQTENLFLQYGDQQAQLQVKAERATDNIFRGEFALSAETLDLNKILPESNDIAKDASGNGTDVPQTERQKSLAEEIGPYDLPIDMAGTLAVNRLIYKKLNIDKVTADLSLKDNYLSIQNLSSQIGAGELKGSSRIHLGVKGFTYNGQMALSQPNVTTLVSGLFPESQQSVSGQLQWQNNFSGRGTLPDNLLQALKLKGDFKLQQGIAKGFPLLEQLAGFFGSPELKVLSFQSLTGQYNLQDGLTHINAHLDSSKAKLTPTGTINVDGRLNLHLDARFAPEILDKLGVSKSLKETVSDQNGWGKLPLQIQGTFAQPKIGYDSKALQNQAVNKAKEKASQELLEKIAPGAGEEAEPIRKMLDNTLNKLFGK